VQASAVLGAEAGAAAVVDVHDGEASRRPELDPAIEGRIRRRDRAAVPDDDERWQLPGRATVIRVVRRVIERVRGAPAGSGELDRLRRGDEAGVELGRTGP